MPTAGEPIRVLRVIARLNVGGPALHVSYLSKELDELGYDTTLVAGQVGEGEGSMEYVARDLGIEPLFVPELQREISAAPDAAAIWRLLRLIREVRPHVLHTHTAKAGAVGRAATLLAGSARPQAVVHTFHGHVLRGYFSPRTSMLFRHLERQLARTTDALVAVSPQVRDDLVRLGVAPAQRVAVIRLGLDLAGRVGGGGGEAIRRELGLPPERFLVGWLGRLTEIKRADHLLHAFAILRSRGVDSDLALVGDGPLRPGLERLAEELGIAERCHFIGYRPEVGALFDALDVFALTSANEGTPVVAIEALAAGRPVVAMDVGGVADVVEDGRSGFLVPYGDTVAVADRLEQLAEDAALRRALGEEGRGRVVSRYSIPRLVGDIDRLYRTLLGLADVERRRVVRLTAPLVPALPSVRRRVLPARRRLRVILLSQYFPPEVGATQSRMQAFAEYLSARGHQVTVICEFPNHPHGVFEPHYAGHLWEDDRSNDYRILRIWVMARPEKTQMTRMAFYLSYMALATVIAPLAGRADVVLATSPPLFTGVAGRTIARLNGAPFVLDVRDLWPAAAVSLEQISSGVPVRVAEVLERWLYRQASAVVAVTRPFCDHIDALRGSRGPATVLIPNGTLDLFFTDGQPRSREDLGLPRDGFLVTFAGTHGIAQGLPAVLDAADRTRETIEFAFVGDGPMKATLVAAASDRGLTNVHFHAQRPLEDIPPLLAASDALLVPLSGHPTFTQFVPSKMIDFMAAGRPILLSVAGEAARILELAGGGLAIPPEDAGALAGAASWLSKHPRQAEEMGASGRAFARRRLRSIQAERLEQLLLDVAR